MSDALASPPLRKRPRPSAVWAPDQPSTPTELLTATSGSSLRCCYRSKQCHNERALKLNGDHHKLCEFHRQRANLNQQRVHQRRKLQLRQSERLASETSSAASSPRSQTGRIGAATAGAYSDTSLSSSHFCSDAFWRVPEPFDRPCGDLAVCDLVILKTLLFSSTPPPPPGFNQVVSPTVSFIYEDSV